MYVAVKGGEAAILATHDLIAEERRGDVSVPELSVVQIREQMQLSVARVMNEGVGTLFLPRPGKAKAAAARKVWLGGRLRLKGSLTVDAGAAKALAQGSSLLARGIVAAEGHFARGDAVAIRDEAGAVLAHGLCEYDAAECALLIGHHSSEHAALLGYAPRSAIVHRDQLVLL